MARKVLVLLAEGFEEVETVTPIDYLRRAGIEVTVTAIGDSLTVKGSRGVSFVADKTFADFTVQSAVLSADVWDAVVIPGGLNGANNLAACKKTGALLKAMSNAGKYVCAICASPALVLAPLGLLAGKKYTCYPGMEEKVSASAAPGSKWCEDRVVVDGNIITSRAAGTTGEFAAAIISKLLDDAAARKVTDSVLLLK
jgi:4-methyl-5(b-hydroxyethyl)-thiazole monophosphate biosynthesis